MMSDEEWDQENGIFLTKSLMYVSDEFRAHISELNARIVRKRGRLRRSAGPDTARVAKSSTWIHEHYAPPSQAESVSSQCTSPV